MRLNRFRWINTIAFLLMVTVNAAANLIPIGIGTTGEISDLYRNLFTPAPITFAIWGVIYFLLAIFVLYGWGILDRGRQSGNVIEGIGIWFAVSCFLNIGWIFAWHFNQMTLSVLLIAGLLVSLVMIVGKLKNMQGTNVLDSVAADAGFQLYFGWIIAATIANVSVLLTKAGWNGFGLSPVLWTCLVLVVGALIGATAAVLNKKCLPTVAIIWAYVGILFEHMSAGGYNGKYFGVILTIILCLVLMILSIFAVFFYRLNTEADDEDNCSVCQIHSYKT